MRMPFHRVNYEANGWNENNDIQQHDMILMSSNQISIFFSYEVISTCLRVYVLTWIVCNRDTASRETQQKTYTNTIGYSKLTAAVAAAVIKLFYDVFNLYQHKHTYIVRR